MRLPSRSRRRRRSKIPRGICGPPSQTPLGVSSGERLVPAFALVLVAVLAIGALVARERPVNEAAITAGSTVSLPTSFPARQTNAAGPGLNDLESGYGISPVPETFTVARFDRSKRANERQIVYMASDPSAVILAILDVGAENVLSSLRGWDAGVYERVTINGRPGVFIRRGAGSIVEWTPATGCGVRLRLLDADQTRALEVATATTSDLSNCAPAGSPPPALPLAGTIASSDVQVDYTRMPIPSPGESR